jgi:small subunit ribosomal protein S1
MNAFLPISQLSMHFIKETEKHIGKSYEFIITQFERKKKNIVLSRRKILENEKNAARLAALESITEGQIIDGIVSNIANFGAFIDIGGIDGLLHIGDIAWYKVKKVEDLLHLGQTVKVQVSKVDKVNGKISLNMKNLTLNSWDYASERFPEGLIMKGIVTSIMNYGAFVKLEPGIEGLLPISEYAWNDAEATFKREVKKDQEIEVKIINVDKENKKIALSVKRIHANPWGEVFRHYPPGTIVKGIVQNLVPFGAFVKLPEGIEGLIHINNFSWTAKVKHPKDFLKKGDEIEVVVLEVNPKNEKVLLSLKHINPDPYEKYKIGTIIKGKVVRTVGFGAFVELEPGIEALIKNNEIFSIKTDKTEPVLKKNEEVEAKVIKVDVKDRKIEASVKKLEFDREKELIKKYTNQNEKPTLGEILEEE